MRRGLSLMGSWFILTSSQRSGKLVTIQLIIRSLLASKHKGIDIRAQWHGSRRGTGVFIQRNKLGIGRDNQIEFISFPSPPSSHSQTTLSTSFSQFSSVANNSPTLNISIAIASTSLFLNCASSQVGFTIVVV